MAAGGGGSRGDRPEHKATASSFYSGDNAAKYTAASRIVDVQTAMAERCLELVNFPASRGPQLVLDIGCGSGLSGAVLSDAGHAWIGTDVAADMLSVALERGADGDFFLEDMGQGLSFRAGSFDGAISVSAIQWLCYATEKRHNPWHRANRFFRALYRCLKRGARAALQFYPERPEHVEMLTTAALRAGFVGGVVVDNPNSTKARKYYLVIDAGISAPAADTRAAAAAATAASTAAAAAAARREDGGEDDEHEGRGGEDEAEEAEEEEEEAAGAAGATRVSLEEATAFAWSHVTTMRQSEREKRRARQQEREAIRTDPKALRAWKMKKKEAARTQGKHVTRDSKYSGRRRPGSLVR